jgi:hypothetical protein
VKLAVAVIMAAFALSRVAAHAAGIRFDATPLTWYWQYIDPVLLQERLLESLYYSHTQPPLFNLLLGINLKLFPSSFSTAMHTGPCQRPFFPGFLALVGERGGSMTRFHPRPPPPTVNSRAG